MLRYLLQRRRETEQLIGVEAIAEFHSLNACDSGGERTRLVEHHGPRPRQRLEGAAALDQHAVSGRGRDAGHNRYGGGQDQRAGSGNDQDRQCSDGIVGDQPGQPGHGDGEREEGQRPLVGEPDERGLLLLCGFDQPDDVGIGAVGGGRVCPQPERPASVDRAAAQGGTRSIFDRHGLTGEGRFVNRRRLSQQGAVNRKNLAALHNQTVAGPNLLDRQILETIGKLTMRRSRAACQQGGELTVGAALGELLQHVAPGEHQRDHHAGQGFAQRQCPCHGEAGDDVHARLTPPQLATDLREQQEQCRYDPGAP